MESDRERLVRERAYAIWEREGRPTGRAEAHWFQALRELQTEGQLPGLRPTASRISVREPVRRHVLLPPWGRRHWCHLSQRAA